jgi:hypothetical protein
LVKEIFVTVVDRRIDDAALGSLGLLVEGLFGGKQNGGAMPPFCTA